MSSARTLQDAWAVLRAAHADQRAIRVEPTGVSINAGDVLAGLDIYDGLHLLVPVDGVDEVHEDRRSAGVQIRAIELEERGQQLPFADVVCLVPALNDLFSQVAADMLEALLLEPGDPSRRCREVLERWRELLERPDPRLLGPQQLAGLFGELLYVRELVHRNPISGIGAWTGPAKKQHDFARGAIALEVKSSTVREGRIVQIHGIDQLDAPTAGSLYLAFVRLDVDGTGTAVPDLVEEVLALGVNRETFLGLLSEAGYDYSKASDYAYPRLTAREQRLYLIDDAFPRVVASSFAAGGMPAGVLRLRYDVDLTGEPPRPLDEASSRSIVDLLASAA